MTKETPKQDTGKEIEELKQQYTDIKETLQRVHAEFQNFKKRTDEDKKRFITLANQELIQKLLPLADNFELALEHNKEKTEFSKGIEMIYSQLKEILDEEGLQRILCTGKFNPEEHEAIMVEESEKENGTILEELQPGYKIGDRVIRHTKVKIAKNKTPQGGKQNE